jgi:F-type H+-transporting ATPase subunit a
MVYSPFEQFVIRPILNLNFLTVDLTLSNVSFCLILLMLCAFYTIHILLYNKNSLSFHAIPTFLEIQIFLYYLAIQSIIEKHIHIKYYQQLVFPLIFSLGVFLLFVNLSGNLPIFLSITSQFAVITSFCIPIFLGFFFLFLIERNITFLRIFYAPGTDTLLAIVLFPVEILTFLMRPISIVCRLCSNIMSGHVIVKVCLHTIFALCQLKNSSNFFLSIAISAIILQLVPLLLLEFCVSLIQVYVFLVIFCMFLSDIFGHHFSH